MLAARLRRLGARLITMREVHVLVPRGARKQRSNDGRRDLRLGQTTAPNSLPTKAVNPKATAPQRSMRQAARAMGAPPA